jgi:hypothetical protein
MEKVEIRTVIIYLCKKGMSPNENFMDILEKESLSYSTVKWAAEFKRGRASI